MRSVKHRLALLFYAITLASIAVVYFYVVPRLEDRLREERLRGLAAAAQAYSGPLVRAIGTNVSQRRVDRAVRQAADRANARVTLLGISRGDLAALQTYPISDSTADARIDDLQFQVAAEAARSGRTVTGSEAGALGRVGEAARPLFFRDGDRRVVARVVVFSAPLRDVQSNVELIQRQIVIAGLIALALAVLAGYLVARAMSLRMKRLEQAARKVAAGDFSHPIPVDSDDELGQLAVAFNDMQRRLAQLDEARKQFIAIASHELRTPIFSLGGFVELLQDEELDEETRDQFLTQLREQVDRLGRLATELLDLSRLEAGSLELRPERVDVAALARAVVSEFTPALARHDSHLELRLAGEPLVAECDPERVAQIMRILIDNALTHTPPGTEIQVSAARQDGALTLVVRDRGLGIKRAVIDQIFEPFFTADDTQGTGLGLAIARELAERMDGRLAVESVPGRTTFTLEIPT